ncbi:acylneuraminate cytidylyltransferase family protein [Thiomicrorhabdus lithotrophica]|uniref:Acylneuraminate cytidylyltransferase family protein n=1 Tax=Thiomicrorhabdus lithotrophica TaxID=2949997 RepID=A0ABY8CCQ6_9GAMM|nr:acylneuraminate cytidylyltransferase family protein [Thiomicrorhabdus lithotrophica]WEJ63790.1 acylneuraminate cytidylyltransferase family protein [Thiomicrorhabdus lithotrophica]
MTKSICLIPAKGASTRLPNKNKLPLDGKPLVTIAIEKALKSAIFDEVCVSTEDLELSEMAKNAGASVPFIRPESLSHDPATIVDVMLHAIAYYEQNNCYFDDITVLLPTSPFVDIEDIIKAHEVFNNAGRNALLSVTEAEFPPYNAWLTRGEGKEKKLAPCFPDSPFKNTKSTECPVSYRSNGAILIVNVAGLKSGKGYKHMDIVPYIMPAERSLDIDVQLEYEFAKFLTEYKK